MSEATKARNFFNDMLYGGHRQLPSLGHRCDVVARSLMATKAGDRGKPNRRDATVLARLRRAGAVRSTCAVQFFRLSQAIFAWSSG